MKVVILIDGGNSRALAKTASRHYDVDYIEKIGLACRSADEEILRILYYDCKPFNGVVTLPISGTQFRFSQSSAWLENLSKRDLFAVRLGVLKFRGFKPKRIPIGATIASLSDNDFKPIFEQKGVDMRIGLDIASYSSARLVDRIILLSQDTDCVPAMKHARKAGLQVVLATLPNSQVATELYAHSDFVRSVAWPT